jgi:imidazole glycerol-phosphate synthase subunit HisH
VDKIAIINYQMGNIGSVAKKIKRIGYEPIIANTTEQVLNASKLILPGVGHFVSAVERLKKSGIWDALNEAVLHRKIPILGICLGMQLMAKRSEEGDCEGYAWFDADVIRFKVSDTIKFKVPHIGWNTLIPQKPSVLLEGINQNTEFYFVHSYQFKCNEEIDISAKSIYDYPFCSVIEKEHIFGVQFHPEKSHKQGEQLLLNFLNHQF